MSDLSLYETMSGLSSLMVEAARANDWERLSRLEKDVARLRDILVARGQRYGLSEADRQRKLRLIHRLLEDDAEIRRHTEPWMEHVRGYLGGLSRERRVQQAYGRVAGL